MILIYILCSKKEKIKMEVAETKMLRVMCTIIKMDKIRNEYIRKCLGVRNIARKMREDCLM